MSKGSRSRPCDKQKFDENYARVFGPKKLNVWQGAPSKEETPDGIQGNTGNGTRDQSDSRRNSCVPQAPREQVAQSALQAAKPMESPPGRNRRADLNLRPLDTDYWTYSGHRGEFNCPHGVGHGDHVHGCDGCCQRDDFPLWKDK